MRALFLLLDFVVFSFNFGKTCKFFLPFLRIFPFCGEMILPAKKSPHLDQIVPEIESNIVSFDVFLAEKSAFFNQ